MSLLSCLLLVLTLMACSATTPEKNIQEANMMASTDESMTRGSWFGIGSLINQKIQNKKKLIQQKIQNKKKIVSTIIGKRKSIFNKRAVFDSVESPKENDEAKMMASTDESMARSSWFGIGSLIKQKIQNKKKFVSSIIGKKKSIKNRRAVLDSAESPEENTDVSKTRGSWFGIGSLIKQKIQNKKKLIHQKIQNKKKFVNSIITKKKNIKEKGPLSYLRKF